jgi:acyl-[acyl-carrier-protein]-phospholipid O-acyltransferase/long-chain-fatty-acid--[acyl-carrier-protein] ligase
MILAIGVVCAIALLWCALALALSIRHGIGFRQALLFVPLRLYFRVESREMRAARLAPAPTIYLVLRQSRIEPALMLSLLPDDTLHILDEYTARAVWMEPWRELARTIGFNARHVFVSRRLVRRLRAKGRLAVYIPDEIEPDQKSFRLLRAVGRIAAAANANVIPIMVENAARAPGSLADPRLMRRRLFPRLRIRLLPAMTIADMVKETYDGRTRMSGALFDRIAQLRMRTEDSSQGLFDALLRASASVQPGHAILQDATGESLTYGDLLTRIRALAARFDTMSAPGDPIGILLPNSNAFVVSFFALQSAARIPTLLNFSAGPAAVTSAIKATLCRQVITSRRFVEEAKLGDYVAAIEAAGAKMLWLEDLRDEIGGWERVSARIMRRRPLQKQDGSRPAAILFTSGSEGKPKGVVLSGANIVSNCLQVRSRIAFSPQDVALNVLPAFHAFGLTGGTILPLIFGVRLVLYPSPLHFRAIPELAAKVKPTILFGTDTFLSAYARASDPHDFDSLRLIVAGAEPVRAATRALWREKHGLDILEGYGMTEASPVIALNTHTHGKEGTVGRLLPGMHIRLEPVEGLAAEGEGLLSINGPNIMLGYTTEDKPGQIVSTPDGWHETGDIVAVDREGYLSIRGRARRFAKVAGEMVSLAGVEGLAQDLRPEERHLALAVPDARKGERVVLMTTSDLTRDAMRREGKKRGLPDIMAADEVLAVEDIPVLTTGKIDFPKARQIALQMLGLDEAA